MLGRNTISKIIYITAAAAIFASCAHAKKEKFFAYRSFWPEAEAMKQFADAGINTYAVMPSNSFNTLGEPYCKYPPFWVWDETYLWDVVDEQFDVVLKQNPNAKLICIIDLNSPIWLLRRINRQYGMGGDSYQEITNSLCVKEWRELTEKMVAAYVRHMEQKYGDKIFAYMVAGGGTSEWYCCAQGRAGAQKEAAWAQWLKSRGLPNWDTPTYKQTTSPAFEDRFFDPSTQKPVIEYARFHEELVANGMDDFAKIVRNIVGDKRQIGSFCGFNSQQFSGKLDNTYTYNSKYLDFLGSPGGYNNRKIGMGGGMDSALKSLSLTNKHWFQEIDHRTHTYNGKLTPYVEIGGIHADGAKNQAETDAVLKREFALAAVMGNSLWCFDMWGGIFKTPETMSLVKRAHEIWTAHKDDNLPCASEIALIIDPESGLYTKYPALSHIKKILYSTGAPFDNIMFRDIPKTDFSKYKTVVFAHSFEITPEKEKILKDHVFKDGRTVLTMGAFGACDGSKIDAASVERLTGFKYATKGVNEKQMEGWKSVYFGDIGDIKLKDVRKIAEDSGVHFYTDETVPVYANERLVAVHVKDGGVKTVRLAKKCKRVVELFSNKEVAKNTDKFYYEFKSPDTALFELQD